MQVEGASEAAIAEWDVGFTQTFISDSTQAKYAGAKQKCFTMFQQPFDPVFDGRKDSAPFYHPQTMAAASGAKFFVATNDHPSSIWAWYNRCTKVTDDGSSSNWQDGPLRKTCGSYRLVTRLIARHRPTNRIRFLNFVVWEVDFGAAFDNAKKVTPSGGAKIAGQGEGKGNEPSVLEGADANRLFSARAYDCELDQSCKSCTPRKSGR